MGVDLRAFYREATRILRPGGLLLIAEYHPFRRVWRYVPERLIVENSYLERGPFYYESKPGLFDRGPGTVPSYQCSWTIADFYRAVTEAGCSLFALEEIGDAAEDWEIPPLAGLPQLLLLAARKRPPPAQV
jgi:hypothetical protein